MLRKWNAWKKAKIQAHLLAYVANVVVVVYLVDSAGEVLQGVLQLQHLQERRQYKKSKLLTAAAAA